MPASPDRRARKRSATRQGISDAATHLFMARGFDRVTIDEIAAAADVGRMTVFNHFARKEDLFFDRDEEVRELLRTALRGREPGVTPVESLRLLVHRLVTEKSPLVHFTARSQRFIDAIKGSETLQARARAIRDELAQVVATAMAEGVGRKPVDPDAQLAAGLLLATWTVAFIQAHQVFRLSRSTEQAETTFLALADQGAAGLITSLAGTPYA